MGGKVTGGLHFCDKYLTAFVQFTGNQDFVIRPNPGVSCVNFTYHCHVNCQNGRPHRSMIMY